MLVPPTTQRVAVHTARHVNEKIQAKMAERVQYYAEHPGEINERLRKLEHEWDVERLIEMNASLFALLTVILSATISVKILWLTGAVLVFLFQHAVQGWCPPIPILRRIGMRTQTEIEAERFALRMLRGDFDAVCGPGTKKDCKEILARVSQT